MYYESTIFSFFLFFSSIISFSCNESRRNNNNYEITIEKRRIDSINFEAKVIVSYKSQIKSNDIVYILIDNETKLDSTIKNIKEKFLNNKEVLNKIF